MSANDGSDSSDVESIDENYVSLAKTRERRPNAGSKMSSLLDQEEQADDVYKTLYGGFEDVEHDSDFEEVDEEDPENVIDSDFDCDETAPDEADDDFAAEKEIKLIEKEEKRKSKKIYRDPKPKNQTLKKPVKPKVAKSKDIPSTSTFVVPTDPISRNLRQKTKQHSRDIKTKIQKRRPGRPKKVSFARDKDNEPLTQEELLEEAKLTEKANIESLKLAAFNAEIEKSKQVKTDFRSYKNIPMIKHYSKIIYVTDDEDDNVQTNGSVEKEKKKRKVVKSWVVFPDQETFEKCFPTKVSTFILPIKTHFAI